MARVLVLCITLSVMMLADATVQADGYDDRRVRAGARLFRTLLAADIAVETRVAADGSLPVVVLGGDAATNAEVSALIVPPDDGDKARIRGLPVRIEILEKLPEKFATRPAGVFLASPPPAKELERLVRWSIDNRVILYSPYEGHVERGVMAGIAIEAKVQPYLNAASLGASGIELKPFFLKVAKVHE